jgi:uncharacterized protein YjbJ (UPF0337 family)
VTSAGQAAGAAQQAAGVTASTAKDEAARTASTAASAAGDVAGTAKQQAGQVAGEAVNQARQLADQARGEASAQLSTAADKLGDLIRSFATEIRDLSQGNADSSGKVAGLASQLAGQGERWADQVAELGPEGLLREVRSFAARKPGTFLLGALAAGVATGRLVRGAVDAGSNSPSYSAATDRYGVQSQIRSYPATTPVPVSSYGDVVDDGSIGPVSGDQRLIEEADLVPPYGSDAGYGSDTTYGSGTTYGSEGSLGTGSAFDDDPSRVGTDPYEPGTTYQPGQGAR